MLRCQSKCSRNTQFWCWFHTQYWDFTWKSTSRCIPPLHKHSRGPAGTEREISRWATREANVLGSACRPSQPAHLQIWWETKEESRNELEEASKPHFRQRRCRSLLCSSSCLERQFCRSHAMSRRKRLSPSSAAFPALEKPFPPTACWPVWQSTGGFFNAKGEINQEY